MKISLLETSGTHYEVGHDIGKTFKDNIAKATEGWDICMDNAEFVRGKAGKEVLAGYKSAAEEAYPQYVDEIRGMADGADIPEDTLWAANLWCELYRNTKHNARYATPMGHCSDIMVNNADTMAHVHNEDGFESFEDITYIVSAHITDDKQRGKFWSAEERFTAYCWPGCLPGYCFGFNDYGMTHTINTLAPHTLLERRVPVAFLVRAALAAKSFDEIEEILKDEGHGIALGISLNSACSLNKSPKVFCNFETLADPDHNSSIVKKTVIGPTPDCDVSGPYFHANIYQHIDTLLADSFTGKTSPIRRAYYDQFPPPTSVGDLLKIIGDEGPTGERQEDTLFNLCTIATGVFDLKKNTLAVYGDNPKRSTPEHTFQLPA